MRESGVLLPVASLPSAYGIGCFSKEAYEFVDRLKEAGQSYWQILPLGPTSYGDSPYQSFSTFAGNPYFIDPEDLVERGWITGKQCEAYDFGSDPGYIDYGKIYESRFLLLKEAWQNSHIGQDPAFQRFVEENYYWLEDYALYMAVKTSFGGVSWEKWDEDIRVRRQEALDAYRRKYVAEIEFYQFQQYLFRVQWEKLKAYANSQGIQIIGDMWLLTVPMPGQSRNCSDLTRTGNLQLWRGVLRMPSLPRASSGGILSMTGSTTRRPAMSGG